MDSSQLDLFGGEPHSLAVAGRRRRNGRSNGHSSRSQSELVEQVKELQARVVQLEDVIVELRDLVVEQRTVKESYTTIEVAQLLGKKPYTVREWCRLQRVNATKAMCGRGCEEEWRISHEELMRIRNEGLLPIPERY